MRNCTEEQKNQQERKAQERKEGAFGKKPQPQPMPVGNMRSWGQGANHIHLYNVTPLQRSLSCTEMFIIFRKTKLSNELRIRYSNLL